MILCCTRVAQNWRVCGPGLVSRADTLSAHTLDGTKIGDLAKTHDAGFFEGAVKLRERQPLRFEAANAGGNWHVIDPYSFGPVLGPLDDYYVAQGTHLRLYDKMGAHVISHEGVTGVHFAVWAPNAQRVSVIGDFNEWDGRRHVMRKRMGTGVWEIFLPGLDEESKIQVRNHWGRRQPLATKADPYAFAAELRPHTASVVSSIDHFSGPMATISKRARCVMRAVRPCPSMKCISAPGAKKMALIF
jgi:1,4-alpha-glucan branching enzyme